MLKLLQAFATCLLIAIANTSIAAADNNNKYVTLKTDLGTMLVELYPEQAPITVANFLQYVDSGFYDGTIFHRVIPGFVVQGGGFTFDFNRKETGEPIKNESDNGLKNHYLTLSMARTSAVDSATSQFFINLNHNESLDGSADKPGYAVFGKVIDGEQVVEKIVAEPRGIFRAYPDAPNAAVRILEAKRGKHMEKAAHTSKLKEMIAE
ncbi:peptidylprolyl isomerase [Gilvimarinus sp. DA14]|uniref:peptidylprolyl isomerase n=1 Tax=Gilvimarinus sp. DA14 TaxID=2956798 RepID=UPI0020B8D00B|nr:peptidylprolyl isomerase [Gilvimarinus sp. DA14]UTF60970.1 peptidylprolyl isomerase [Gilvimarinus sp. DA14]